MKKRIISLILALTALNFILVGCNDSAAKVPNISSIGLSSASIDNSLISSFGDITVSSKDNFESSSDNSSSDANSRNTSTNTTTSSTTNSKNSSSKNSSKNSSSKNSSSKNSSKNSSSKNSSSKNSSTTSSKPTYSVENKVEKLTIKRGINVSLLYRQKLSSITWQLNKYIYDSNTYKDIKSKGFDHVRLPVDFDLYYKNGKVDESFLNNLDKVLKAILDNGLVVVLDFHGIAKMNSDVNSNKAEFYAIWEQLAERYKDYSDNLLFELYNEPKVEDGPDPFNYKRLNEVQKEVIKRIRKTNPTRIIVAASPDWNTWWGLADLELPADDPNIIVDIHTYQPMDFTHQGETWYDPNATEQVHISNAVYTEINKVINACVNYKNKTGRTLWLGEFGMNTTISDKDDLSKYLSYVTNKAESIGMPWAIWEYGWNPYGQSGFDIHSIKNKKWNSTALEAIIK